MLTGDVTCLIAETERRFEERAVFGIGSDTQNQHSPASWLASLLEDVANYVQDEGSLARPILVQAPIAALLHRDTPLACDAAIKRTRFCPQEICIEFADASLNMPAADTAKSVRNLRKKGFRVSVNSMKSWAAPMDSNLQMMLDTLRVDARKIETEPDLRARIEASAASGIAIIAENAAWRDGEMLAKLGVCFARAPRSDA
tara:strand:- start:13 stop:615 length:603 start_codon:yes stop_codon:yes gene_type:complete